MGLRRHCEWCHPRTRYKHIHVRSGSAIHGLTRSWGGTIHNTGYYREKSTGSK
jgi:hypothetical protein